VEITYLTKREGKRIQRGDFGSKLNLNDPYSVDKNKKGVDS